ncbi:L-lactate dehydrogenase [Candidatus Kinetoplastibacterium desouzaii TCC079E]|uniref:L-lactate dehydrogenase n=1 Tax=Candidatus Kinetoplastidibacterium desouzai TCC079E TaxID=1208919 RepID=M1M4U4_9PROT|nr:Ldh family oxidoreductase [Candidatus Kinetoplastibacterium desouzaii]AGF47210.1 L-lactate dehydrogenase [Candidatus Kinetoplastibacterium desouzaii TCC079E]
MKLSIQQALNFGKNILMAQGIPSDIAFDVAEHIVTADQVGYTSHGLSILPTYYKVLLKGFLQPDGRPELVNDQSAILGFDGNKGFGQHVGKVVVKQAIDRAKKHGQCLITISNSHHLGRMGHYGEIVAKSEMILLAFTNVINRDPTVAPYGGAKACMTTNPLCFAIPLPNNKPPFIVDMATSSIAINKARVLATKGLKADPGTLIDSTGNPTNDPNALFSDPPGALLPFGAHKGYALGLTAELLAGILTSGGTIQPGNPRRGAAMNNMFAIIINPKLVNSNEQWMIKEANAYIDYLNSCPTQPGVTKVQYPGEYEYNNKIKNLEYIEYEDSIWDNISNLAKKLEVTLEK